MNLDYKNIEKFKGLSSVKLEYAQWFNSICATLAYIDQFQIVKGTKLPTLFPQWLENNIEGGVWRGLNFLMMVMVIKHKF